MLTRLAAAALLIPLIAACGGSSASVAPSGSARPSTGSLAPSASPAESAPESANPTEEPSPTPEGPMLLLGCEQAGPSFDAANLTGEPGAEQTDDPAAAALRDYLAGPDGSDLPANDWKEFTRTRTLVLFGQDDPGGEEGLYVTARVELSDGAWSVGDAGPCRPRTWWANTYGLAADWKLSAKVSKTATSFRALITEYQCASGKNASGRMAKPRIVYDETSITITIGVRPLGGEQDCPANPATPLTVRLEEPLGDRTFFNGGPYPAVEVEQP